MISIGDAVLKITGDTKGLDGAMKGAEANVKTASQKMQTSLRVVGAAFTAVGAAGLAMIQSTKKINAQLGVTALSLGITTKEMRDLTLATTNVTFPIDEVTASFDLLSRAGIKDIEVLQNTATAFDTLGDALGMSASQVTEVMVPAMKTFRLSAEEITSKTDIMTYMVRNSTISLEDFNTMVGYTSQDMVDAGLTIDDMAAAMMFMSDSGVEPGKVMLREWNKAVTQSEKEGIALTEALGMTSEALETYQSGLQGATGMTQQYADIANEQYTLMDKLKQRFQELTLQASSFLEPMEPLLAGMTALGPLMIALSTNAGIAAVKWGLHTAALVAHNVAMAVSHPIMAAQAVMLKLVTAAQWLWNIALSANPIGLVVIAVGALIAAGVALWKNWDKVSDFFTGMWINIKLAFAHAVKFIINTVLLPFIEYWGKMIGGITLGVSKLVGLFNKELGESIANVGKKFINARQEITAWADNLIEKTEKVKKARDNIKASEKVIAALEEERTLIDERYQAERDAIKETYGEYDELSKLKIQQAEEVHNAEVEALNDRVSEAERAHAELLGIEEEYNEDTLELLNERIKSERAAGDERRTAAQKEYDDAVAAINRHYGVLEDEEAEYTETALDQARERTEGKKKELDKEIDAANKAHNAAMRLLDEEMAAELARYDEGVSAEVKALQDKIDAIDDATDAEELAATRADEKQKLLDLKAAVDSAETEEDKAEATEKYERYKTEVKRKELLRARRAEKESLRDSIEAIRDNAESARDAEEARLQEKYDKQRAAAEKLFNEVTLPAIEKEIAERKSKFDSALDAELKVIDANRLAALKVEGLKYTNPEGSGIFDLMDAEVIEREAFYLEQLEDAKTQVADINKAYSNLQTQYDINVVTHFSSTGDGGTPATTGGGGTPSRPAPTGTVTVKGYEESGMIAASTLLNRLNGMRPYAIAGESRPGPVGPVGVQRADIRIDLDGRTIGEAIGVPLVDIVRVRTAVGL